MKVLLVVVVVALAALSTRCAAQECKNGDHMRNSCNSCVCKDDKWICTKRACERTIREAGAPEKYKRKRGVPIDLKHTPCAPNDHFIIECNKCNCNIQGTGYECSQNVCPQTSAKPKVDVQNVTADSNNHQNGLSNQGRSLEAGVTITGAATNEQNVQTKANGRHQRNDDENEQRKPLDSTILTAENRGII